MFVDNLTFLDAEREKRLDVEDLFETDDWNDQRIANQDTC